MQSVLTEVGMSDTRMQHEQASGINMCEGAVAIAKSVSYHGNDHKTKQTSNDGETDVARMNMRVVWLFACGPGFPSGLGGRGSGQTMHGQVASRVILGVSGPPNKCLPQSDKKNAGLSWV